VQGKQNRTPAGSAAVNKLAASRLHPAEPSISIW